jgi:hypothetical protein
MTQGIITTTAAISKPAAEPIVGVEPLTRSEEVQWIPATLALEEAAASHLHGLAAQDPEPARKKIIHAPIKCPEAPQDTQGAVSEICTEPQESGGDDDQAQAASATSESASLGEALLGDLHRQTVSSEDGGASDSELEVETQQASDSVSQGLADLADPEPCMGERFLVFEEEAEVVTEESKGDMWSPALEDRGPASPPREPLSSEQIQRRLGELLATQAASVAKARLASDISIQEARRLDPEGDEMVRDAMQRILCEAPDAQPHSIWEADEGGELDPQRTPVKEAGDDGRRGGGSSPGSKISGHLYDILMESLDSPSGSVYQSKLVTMPSHFLAIGTVDLVKAEWGARLSLCNGESIASASSPSKSLMYSTHFRMFVQSTC